MNHKNGYDLPKNVAIIYSDAKREYFPTEEQFITEKDAKPHAKIIGEYLKKLKIKPYIVPGNKQLPEILKKLKVDVAMNLVDSVKGNEAMCSSVPGVLEILEIPYTGAGILGISLSENKFLTSKIYQQNGIPTPNHQLFSSHADYIDPTLRYPLICKLNEIHGAVEITADSIVENEKELRNRLKYLLSTYDQSVLVEEFIVGREISAFLLEGLNKKVYLAERIVHQKTGKYTFASFDIQWKSKDENIITYQKYEDPILNEYVRKAFNVSEMADYGKFDIKIDQSGRYFFIDSNANPALGPKETYAPIATVLEMYGLTFSDIIKRLMINTIRDTKGKERLPFS